MTRLARPPRQQQGGDGQGGGKNKKSLVAANVVGDQAAKQGRGGAGQGGDRVVDGRIEGNLARRPGILHHDVISRDVHARRPQGECNEYPIKEQGGRREEGGNRSEGRAGAGGQQDDLVARPVAPRPPA